MNTLTIKEATQGIIRYLKSGKMKDITLRNLINDPQIKIDDSFYSGLDWLVRENKIVFLITPVETYVLLTSIT